MKIFCSIGCESYLRQLECEKDAWEKDREELEFLRKEIKPYVTYGRDPRYRIENRATGSLYAAQRVIASQELYIKLLEEDIAPERITTIRGQLDKLKSFCKAGGNE